MIRKNIKKIFHLICFELKNKSKYNLPVNFSETDKNFLEVFNKISVRSVVSNKRMYTIFKMLKHTNSIEGDIAEVGVYKGGSAELINEVVKTSDDKKHIHLFDTFEGMPETDLNEDIHQKGEFSDVSYEEVKNLFIDSQNVYLYKGVFPETTDIIKNKRFSFVHIDADIYKSVLDSCSFFYERINKGGIILFDDYGFSSCPGAKKAVDLFFEDKKEEPIYLDTGQAFVVKI